MVPRSVWCVCVGDGYADADVRLLREQVRRHLAEPFDFWCLSDRKRSGIDCVIPDDVARYPGWWSKVLLWRYARSGQHLYVDLDAVIVGDLTPLFSDQFAAPANWAQSGHGGIQSSVMAWGRDYHWITDLFDPDNLRPDPYHPFGRYGQHDWWGDQGFLTAMLGDPGTENVRRMGGVCSYKYHCRDAGRPPDWARVVAFHGTPKASECSERWIADALSSTPTRT